MYLVGDHPRVGGEKDFTDEPREPGTGSPPRGRGKGLNEQGLSVAGRITPAWAGKSCSAQQKRTDGRDHPRVGGEKHQDDLEDLIQQGSPPRGRGKGEYTVYAGSTSRITPAWAGKRQSAMRPGLALAGSPPRGRGKAGRSHTGCFGGRITPAWAGKRSFLAMAPFTA